MVENWGTYRDTCAQKWIVHESGYVDTSAQEQAFVHRAGASSSLQKGTSNTQRWSTTKYVQWNLSDTHRCALPTPTTKYPQTRPQPYSHMRASIFPPQQYTRAALDLAVLGFASWPSTHLLFLVLLDILSNHISFSGATYTL